MENKILKGEIFGFNYVLTRKSVKNINIRIKNDGIVYISAPFRADKAYIESVLEKNAPKIRKSIEKLKNTPKIGEKTPVSMRFLGKEYDLKYIEKNKEFSDINGNFFEISTRVSHTYENITAIIKNWQIKKCMSIYKKINDEVYADFIKKGYKIPHAQITIKDMKSRWGSCNFVNGRISMNLKLCEYEKCCIYSVFYHEYMHFIHHDHSKNFHRDLNAIFPDYEKCHKMLSK